MYTVHEQTGYKTDLQDQWCSDSKRNFLTSKTKDTPLDELGYYLPLVVKPCSNGSSIGVYICHTEEEYYDAIHKSFDVDNTDEVVIEPFIKGREFACGILAGKALPLVEIVQRTDSSTMRTNIRQAALPRSVLLYLSMKRRKN